MNKKKDSAKKQEKQNETKAKPQKANKINYDGKN